MANIPTYFNDFLRDIRLTQNQVSACKTGHDTLRERLYNDEELKSIIVSTFIQGSYRRSTAVRPSGDSRSDVDIVVVTNLDRSSVSPNEALELFRPFLKKWYDGKFKKQGRSWGIEMSYVDLDLVPTSAPSEINEEILKSFSVRTDLFLEEATDWTLRKGWLPPNKRNDDYFINFAKAKDSSDWKNEPLWIPDYHADKWDETDPLAQIIKTQEKNFNTSGYYINVVKCIKWWRKDMEPEPKYPKSYPLEHLIYLNCPDTINSIAEGVVLTLESIRDKYNIQANAKITPFIPDHGVPAHNVFGRVNGNDFSLFHKKIKDAATIAREAFNENDVYESAILWKKLFGSKFPDPPKKSTGGNNGFTPREDKSIIPNARFA